jgi:hypothetical protein
MSQPILKSRTVLVLGAGASCPYGFPSGFALRKLILEGLYAENSALFTFLRDNITGPNGIRAFRDEFAASQMYSIDAFLAQRPQFIDLGKTAIAAVLVQHERVDKLRGAEQDHWYQYLWNQIAVSPEALRSANLSIITFNYDRSLEYFLFDAIRATFHLTSPEAAETLLRIQIFHVYGMLGAPHFLSNEGRPYSHELDATSIGIASAGIRVIPEQRDEGDQTLHFVFSELQQAQQICFLGFGYDRLNLRRLRMTEIAKRDPTGGFPTHGKAILGTIYGLAKAEIIRVNRICGNGPDYVASMRCEEFLRNFGCLELSDEYD